MTDLSYDGIYNSLKEIVADKEDYVYDEDPATIARRDGNLNGDCFYAASKGENAPGCLIGHLIHKLNPEIDLNRLDGWGAVGAMRQAGFDISYETKTGKLLHSVQNRQDSGTPWGEALSLAKVDADNYVYRAV